MSEIRLTNKDNNSVWRMNTGMPKDKAVKVMHTAVAIGKYARDHFKRYRNINGDWINMEFCGSEICDECDLRSEKDMEVFLVILNKVFDNSDHTCNFMGFTDDKEKLYIHRFSKKIDGEKFRC